MTLYPDIQRKAHGEVDRVVGDRLPCMDDLPNMPYLRAVISEILRWNPLVSLSTASFFFLHICIINWHHRNVVLQHFTMPRKTIIIVDISSRKALRLCLMCVCFYFTFRVVDTSSIFCESRFGEFQGQHNAIQHMLIAFQRGLLHDPRTYDDPMTFNPDRFIAKPGHQPETDPRKFAFGIGRRVRSTIPFKWIDSHSGTTTGLSR
jgi:hypothetical protein